MGAPQLATPWDALLRCRHPLRVHVPQADAHEVRPGTKTAALLAVLERGPCSTNYLCLETDLEPRQVWGLLKGPREHGQVTHQHGTWTLVPDYPGRDVEKAAALLRARGWRVEPPQQGR